METAADGRRAVMRVLGRTGGDRPGPWRHHRLVDETPAGVVGEGGPELLQRIDQSRLLGPGVGVPARRDDQLDAGCPLSTGAQPGQSSVFIEGEVRIAERNQFGRGFGGAVEFAPARQQVRRAHRDHRSVDGRIEYGGQTRRLRGDPDQMEHRGRRGGGERRSERAQIVGTRAGRLQAGEHGDVVRGDHPDVVAQGRIESVVQGLQRHLDVQVDPGQPAGVGVRPGVRCPPGQGDQDVQIVRVLDRPGAQHRVRVDHGVRLGPGDLLAELRRTVELVRRAGVGRRDTELPVGVGQPL